MPALPMSIVDSLRRQVAYYTLPGLQIFDTLRANAQSLISRLAYLHDNRTARENPVRFEEIFYRFTAHRWVDEISTGGGFSAMTFTVPINGYDSFVPYNVVNIDRPGHKERLDGLMAQAPMAHEQMQVKAMMQVFRTNPLSLTGQTFFNATHSRPAVYGGTFSNLLTPNWVDPAAPTYEEAQALLDDARSRFVTIASVDTDVVDNANMAGQMVIIVHNAAHEGIFSRLRDRDVLPNSGGTAVVPNPYKGTFSLVRDLRPTSGQENYIEIVYQEPNGARPVILVLDKDYEAQVWDDNRVPNGYVAVGGTSMFGLAPGAPWSAVQVQPS